MRQRDVLPGSPLPRKARNGLSQREALNTDDNPNEYIEWMATMNEENKEKEEFRAKLDQIKKDIKYLNAEELRLVVENLLWVIEQREVVLEKIHKEVEDIAEVLQKKK